MPSDLHATLRPARVACNKGRIIGQKRPLFPRHVWSIRVRLEMAGNLRAVLLLLSHTKMDITVRYPEVDIEDALSLSEGIDL